VSFLARQALRAVRAPMIPSLMAQRIRQTRGVDLKAECCRVVAPTLVITGEADLDRVVPAETTRRYASLVRGAQYRLMERTGHIGSLTQPARFARIVADFVHAHRD
jgi:pimeloyl-ACP methyl ester carboxylesterase